MRVQRGTTSAVYRIGAHAPCVTLVALALLVVTPSLEGCGDECTEGEVRCEGNRAMQCSRGSDGKGSSSWKGYECGELHCVAMSTAGHPEVYCALTSTPDERCAASEPGFCVDNRRVYCRGGYGIPNDMCTSPTVCAVGKVTMLCTF